MLLFSLLCVFFSKRKRIGELEAKKRRPTKTMALDMDEGLERLRQGKYLLEEELKQLCERVGKRMMVAVLACFCNVLVERLA